MSRALFTAMAACALAASASAQLSQSTNFRLDDCAFAGGAGGAASNGFAAELGFEPLAGDEITSTSFRATLGFLGVWDPQPGSGPAVFGMSIAAGPTAGGVPVVITGMNFSKLGSAPSVTVSIGGAAASAVSVASNTKITCVTPPGSAGSKNVTVSSSLGADTLAGGYLYSAGLVPYGTGTAGCQGVETLSATSAPTIGNPGFQITCDHAPPSSLGLGLLGTVPDFVGSDPIALGALFHVNLFLSSLIDIDFTSDATGLGSFVGANPSNPALIGVTVYAQVIWYWGGACPLGPLSLSSSRGLAITYEP